MIIAILYKKSDGLSEGKSGHIALTIFFALLGGYLIKYIFGTILQLLSKEDKKLIIFSVLILIIYFIFSALTCIFVSNPDYNEFVNLGLETTLIALFVDFIILDAIVILLCKVLNLSNEALNIFKFGGYLTVFEFIKVVEI